MEINPIKTEADYEAALEEVYALFDAQPDTPERDKLDILATLVEAYEKKHYPIRIMGPPDPIGALEYFIETRGFTPQDLAPYLGNESCIAEILERRRYLTLPMLHGLQRGLGIPADLLAQPYDLIEETA